MLQRSSPGKHREQAISQDKGIKVSNVNIYCMEQWCYTNTGIHPPDKKGFFRFVLPLKKTLVYEVDDIGHVTVHPGNFDFLYLPDVSRMFSISKDSCVVIIDCSFSDEIVKSIQGHFTEALHTCIAKDKPFRMTEPRFVSAQVLQIAYDLINSSFAGELKLIYIEIKALELIVHFLQIIGKQPNPFLLDFKPYDLERLFYVKDFLQHHALTHLTLRTIAREAGINEFKLKKGFKELFGMTVFAHIIQLRMRHALKLLTEEHFTIKEIAYKSGYKNAAHFASSFKRFHGLSPREVKKNQLKEKTP